MKRLIFATHNHYKIQEIQTAIGDELKIITLQEVGIFIDIPEPHPTLEENASEKTRTIYELTKKNCFGEDSGLEVHALNGAPGVLSARYAGNQKIPEDNIRKLLKEMNGMADRAARFRTVISLWWQGQEYQFEGICEGTIISLPCGAGGFGYDPVFMPSGSKLTFAQMDLAKKNIFSHRRKAADQLVLFLQRCIDPEGDI